MGYRRILLLNRIHIGDCIFTTPAIRALRAAYPDASIVAVVPRSNTDLFAHSPCVDAVMPRPVRNWWRKLQFILAVRRQRFDLVVSFQEKSVFYGLAARFSGARQTISLWHWRTHRLYRRTVPWPGDLHRVERYLTLASALGAPITSACTELHVGDGAEERARRLLEAQGVREGDLLVGLNPGSSEAERRWPPARFAEVGERLAREARARIVLFGGARDQEMAAEIAAAMETPAINLAGETRLLETAAVLQQCAVLISGDTGPLHMAAAVGTSIIAMFGPSDPRLAEPRFGASGGRSRLLQNPDSCGTCPGPCLHTITAEECCAAALELLREEAARHYSPQGRQRTVGDRPPSPCWEPAASQNGAPAREPGPAPHGAPAGGPGSGAERRAPRASLQAAELEVPT
jgi:ADP-heptose:LPS heptosyltransferase